MLQLAEYGLLATVLSGVALVLGSGFHHVLRELRVRSTISATAQALNLTPSAVSQQIAALSRDIGAIQHV